MLTIPSEWAALMRSQDQTYVRETLDKAIKRKVTAAILVRRLGADTLRAATVRCYPNSLPGETLRLHHFAARSGRPETLKYLIEEVGGFPVDERTVGLERMSLLHLAAIAGDEGLPPDQQERRLACLRYLIEEQGLSPLLESDYGERPIDCVEACESGVAARQYLLEAARNAENAASGTA